MSSIFDRADQEYPFFGVPPARRPRPAAEEPALQGKRVILSTPDGFVYDMRAVSEPYRHEKGHDAVDIVTEEQFYRWMWIHEAPERQAFPVRLVWVE